MSGQIRSNSIVAVGFDLDNTLYPSTPEIQERIRGRIYQKIAGLFGISFEGAKREFEEEYTRLMSGSKAIGEIARKLGKKYDGSLDIVQEASQEANFLDLIKPNFELAEMLSRMRSQAGVGLDLLTGSEYDFAMDKLARIGLSKNYFDIILDAAHGKTNGNMYREWLKLRETSPEKLLYVGDNKKQDIDVPKSLGIRTCHLGDYDAAEFQVKGILDVGKLFF